jgi:hypothetical protein
MSNDAENMNENLISVARSYTNLLNLIDWEDPLMVQGIREGLNKFLSNAFLSTKGDAKYKTADFYSELALDRINLGNTSELIYEHMVPKQKYIQSICIEKAKKKQLKLEFVVDLLERYWKIAVVTKAEDVQLNMRSMPDFWGGSNIFARYQEVGIKLTQSPFLTKDELWSKLLARVNDSNYKFHNVSGVVGQGEFNSSGLKITSDLGKGMEFKVYPRSNDLMQFLKDGWIL